MESSVATVNDREFFAQIRRADEPILVTFGSSWCQPSQELAPVMEHLAEELKGRVRVLHVDYDDKDSERVRRRFKVSRVPVTMLFSGGEMADFIGGATTKENIDDMVYKVIDRPGASKGLITQVGEHNFAVEVLQSPVPTLVHWHAAWCSASVALLPIVKEAAEALQGQAKVVQVPFGPETARLSAQYDVKRIPTIALVVDGAVEDQILGAMVGGTKVGDVSTSCVGLTSLDNILQMTKRFLR